MQPTKLKYPKETAALLMAIANFNLYDREENVGRALAGANPSDRAVLQSLFDAYFFVPAVMRLMPTAYKRDICEALCQALADKSFDFEWILRHIDDFDGTWAHLPPEWALPYPRYIFEEQCRAAFRNWHSEMSNMGIKLPALESLQIPSM